MRVVFVGASALAVLAAKELIKKKNDVIIIEKDQHVIDDLMENLDCNFINGNATRIEVLKETDPPSCDMLFCLTNHEQNNIIAGLLGNSLGFKQVVVGIKDVQWEKICLELGLQNTIVPDRLISNYLMSMSEGRDIFNLRNLIKGNAYLFSFIASDEHEGDVEQLKLPNNAKVVWLYRDDQFFLPDHETQIKAKDQVVIATVKENTGVLQRMFSKH